MVDEGSITRWWGRGVECPVKIHSWARVPTIKCDSVLYKVSRAYIPRPGSRTVAERRRFQGSVQPRWLETVSD